MSVKPIIIKDNETGKQYTLRFTRASVRRAEEKGFDISDIQTHPMSRVPDLFYYAFWAEHKNEVTREQSDKILFEGIGGLTEEIMERLGELYAEPLNSLIRTDDEPGNPTKMTVQL